MLISQVVEEVVGVDAATGITVNSLEGRVGCEVSDVAEALTERLGVSLALTNSDEDVLEFVFGFVTE